MSDGGPFGPGRAMFMRKCHPLWEPDRDVSGSGAGSGDEDLTDVVKETRTDVPPDQTAAEQRADRRADAAADRAEDTNEVDEDIFPAVDPDLEKEFPKAPEDEEAHFEPFIGKSDETPESAKTVTRVEVPIRTILTVVIALFLIWVFVQLWGTVLQVFLAFLLATALLPLVRRLQHRGFSKGLASLLVFIGLIALIAAFFGIIVPPLINQGQSFLDNAPDYLQRFERFIRRYPSLWDQYQNLRQNGVGGAGETTGGPEDTVNTALTVGGRVVSTFTNFFFVLVLTFYLMLEGDATWNFLSRYFTPRLRYRIARSYPEITRVVSGYVIGQSINSLVFGTFAFVVLWIFGVPEKLLLATLAAVFDAVPIVGVPVATIPAVLLALTVSWQTAVFVVVAYVLYQQFENYVMVPRVFGNTLQVSGLSILVGVLVGGQLLGVIGVILSLPITAAFPVIERVWNEPVPDEIEIAEEEARKAAKKRAEPKTVSVWRRRTTADEPVAERR